MKKVYLEDLPTNSKGIDWENSKEHLIPFTYNGTTGKMKIVDYIKREHKLKIEYNCKIKYISTYNLIRYKIGGIIEKITKEFKVNIGQTFKEDKRDLVIIDREYRKDKKRKQWKWCKYKCNKCGYDEGWIEESSLFRGQGCACCRGLKVVKGINDIATTNSEMVKYFKNIEDAYVYTKSSSKKIKLKCPDCGFEKEIKLYVLYGYGFSCPKCGDGTSYPEKVIINLLKKLNINFKTQLNKSQFKWCNKYLYDFYFEYKGDSYIIETHGMQHYEECHGVFNKRNLKEEQENDKLKYELAIHNGIKSENYISIDCRYSTIEWIKGNILKSKLNYIFDISQINWLEIDKQAQKSKVIEVCEYWKGHNNINNEDLSTTQVGEVFNMSRGTILDYLKRGNDIGICTYDPHKELIKNAYKNGKNNGKQVEIFKDGKSLGKFESAIELEKKSEELFNIKLYSQNIVKVCNGKLNKYKGFTFKQFKE